MNWLDWTILVLIGGSTLLSLRRGFFRESLSLLTWVAAFFVAFVYGPRLAGQLLYWIEHESLRRGVAYVLLFVSTVVLGAFLGNLMASLIRASGLTGTDRALGTVFGLARGLLLAVALLVALRFVFPQDSQPSLSQSRLAPHLDMMQRWVLQHLAGGLPPGENEQARAAPPASGEVGGERSGEGSGGGGRASLCAD